MMGTTCNTHNTCFTPSITLIYNKNAYINIIFSHNLHVIQITNNTQKLDFNLQTQKNSMHGTQQRSSYSDPKLQYNDQFQNRCSEITQAHKPVPANNNIYRNYSLDQPTTRANCHGHFMALKQRLISVGENPYLSKCRSVHCCNSSVC